jgi:hypothetical protein
MVTNSLKVTWIDHLFLHNQERSMRLHTDRLIITSPSSTPIQVNTASLSLSRRPKLDSNPKRKRLVALRAQLRRYSQQP